MNNLKCSVCDSTINGKFCSECGQQVAVKETTFFSLIIDFIGAIIDLEKSVFATLIKLVTNPKKIIKNYWDGNRKYYPSPGKFLLYTLAIAAFHITYFDPFILGTSFDANLFDSEIIFWVFVLPLLIISSYFSFLGSKNSLTKHLISCLYIATTYFIIITLLSDIIQLLLSIKIAGIQFVLFLIFVFLGNSRVHSREGIGFILLGVLIQFVVLTLTIAIFILSIYLIDANSVSINQ